MAHVGLVFVHPSRWRQGIAGALLSLAEAEMVARGYVREQLWTPVGAPAEQFYAARGWERDGRREWHPWVGLEMVGYAQELRVRVVLGAFGDPGHAFPIIALGAELVARGHEVGIETWQRWREPAEAAGMDFSARAGVPGLPDARAAAEAVRGRGAGGEGDAAVRARLRARRRRSRTSSRPPRRWPPSSRACRWRRSSRTSIPTSRPACRRSRSARGARARGSARLLWRQTDRMVAIGLEQGRSEYNDCRARLGLGPLPWTHTGLSRSLTMVGTLPQLEYPRAWPSWLRVVGPLMWEPRRCRRSSRRRATGRWC